MAGSRIERAASRAWWPALGLAVVVVGAGVGAGLGIASAPPHIAFPGGGVFGLELPHGVREVDVLDPLGSSTRASIQITGLTPIPVPGYPTPAVEDVGETEPPLQASADSWPPCCAAGGERLAIRPFVGATIATGPGRYADLMVGLTPSPAFRGSGVLAAAGFDVSYLDDGSAFTSVSDNGVTICVDLPRAQCERESSAATTAIGNIENTG